MSNIIRGEMSMNVFGVGARAFNVICANGDLSGAANPGHILNQEVKSSRRYRENGKEFSITVTLRFDDHCRNGHEDFSVTADIREIRNGASYEYTGGCCHDEIAKHFPEWSHLIKWHLTSTDGPIHYIQNTLYQADDRDCWGLRKGEKRQIKNGRTGELCWHLEAVNPGKSGLKSTFQTDEYLTEETVPLFALVENADGVCPANPPEMRWVPWCRTGEGKERNLEAARHCAVWPEATDEELMQDRETLKAALEARLPALKAAFKRDMLAVGFVWPEWMEEKEAA